MDTDGASGSQPSGDTGCEGNGHLYEVPTAAAAVQIMIATNSGKGLRQQLAVIQATKATSSDTSCDDNRHRYWSCDFKRQRYKGASATGNGTS